MELQKISKRTRTMWYLRNVCFLLICGFIMTISAVMLENIPASIIAGASWLIMAVLLLIWPSLAYKNYSYGYDDKRFYIAYGVIFKHGITAPLCQIQDLHFYEGPIMRLFKIGKVTFSTGGSNFELMGLDRKTALMLVDEVENLLRARIEVNGNEEV